MNELLESIKSERKLRLFACACVRQIWHLLTDDRSKIAVETAEKFADGLATKEQLAAASTASVAALAATYAYSAAALAATYAAAYNNAVNAAYYTYVYAANAAAYVSNTNVRGGWRRQPKQISLLKEEFIGKSYNITPNLTTIQIAKEIYETRNFKLLPILADSLEDDGCTIPEVLDHLREDREHYLGCWVLDTILNKG